MNDPMDGRSENRYATERGAPVGHLPRNARVTSDNPLASAGSVACQNFITLPSWFSAAQGHAVLRLKGKLFALVSDAQGTQSIARVDDLAAAPAHKSLAWSMTALGPAVADVTPVDEALRIMDQHGATCVPVVLGGVVLGVLSRDAAREALATDTARSVCPRLAA